MPPSTARPWRRWRWRGWKGTGRLRAARPRFTSIPARGGSAVSLTRVELGAGLGPGQECEHDQEHDRQSQLAKASEQLQVAFTEHAGHDVAEGVVDPQAHLNGCVSKARKLGP